MEMSRIKGPNEYFISERVSKWWSRDENVLLNHICSIEMYWNEPTPPSFAFQMRTPFWFYDSCLPPLTQINRQFQQLSCLYFPLFPSPFCATFTLIRNTRRHSLGVFSLPPETHMICYTNAEDAPKDISLSSSNQRIILFLNTDLELEDVNARRAL